MNIYNAMNTAKWSLMAHQTAIEVTGQNIANVANPNYSRQEVTLDAQYPVNDGRLLIGSGVMASSVKRQFDPYIFGQTLEANFNLEKWSARESVMGRLDILMNEAGDNGIHAQMSNLFQGFYNLSSNPEGMTERTDLVQKGISLTQKLSSISTDLKRVRSDMDQKIQGAMSEINRLTGEVVNLNKLIHESETETATANDYRDMREGVLKDLSKLVDVSYFEQSNNEIAVMMNNGRPLVIGQSQFVLSTRTSANDPNVSEVRWADSAGNITNISSEITGGALGAWLALRDSDIPTALDGIDAIAGNIIKDINRLHNSGFALDGTSGNNFFTQLTGGGRADVNNTGGALLTSATVTNQEVANIDHFKLTFDGAGNVAVFNSDLNSASGTYSFTSGSAMTFFQNRGLNVTITGAPVAGDRFYVSGSYDAGYNMAVDSSVLNNAAKVAAGATTNSGDGLQARRMGDLQYAKVLGGQWSSAGATNGVYAASGLFTFDDYLGSLVGAVGSSASQAESSRIVAESVSNQVLNLRESVSGVSLDEEMVNIIKYQTAYSASAKMITTIDELLQTLLNIA